MGIPELATYLLAAADCVPLYGIALTSSDSVNGQHLLFHYPLDFCGPEMTPKFHSNDDYTGWRSFAQLFNPLTKTKDIIVSMGSSLTMIPRCIVDTKKDVSVDSSAYVLVLLVNRSIVSAHYDITSFETLTSQLAMCYLKEEKRCNYLSQEKAILMNILNEFKQAKDDHAVEEQFLLNLQLEQSILAKELAEIYHQINHFHHVSIMLNNILPFHFTIPSPKQPDTTIHFYTSENPVFEVNIEQYYSILLYEDASFYLRASKCEINSLLARFIEIASPFLTFEAMSVLLNVPIEKIFSMALSLQRSNKAIILMCITKRTHFLTAPELTLSQIRSESRTFESLFKDFGNLTNLLGLFSNAPALENLFPQYNLVYNPNEKLNVFNMITWLMQRRLILPLALYCQYIPLPILNRRHSINDTDDHDNIGMTPHLTEIKSRYNHSTQNLFNIASPIGFALDAGPADTPITTTLNVPLTSKIRNSTYYPLRMHTINSFSDIPEAHSSFAMSSLDTFGERSRDQISKLAVTPGSQSSFHYRAKSGGIENHCVNDSSLLEKCLPLMEDHYCIDEICYKLSISHYAFREMLLKNPNNFYIYYVVADK